MASRLLSKINDEFEVSLTMRDLFSAPSVYAMARLLEGSERISPEQFLNLRQQVEAHDIKDNV